MATQRQTRLPNLFRNPLVALEVAGELLEHAENVEKAAAEEGRTARERPRVLKIKAFAKELEANANARIGTQLDD